MHIEHFKKGSVGQILAHINRTREDGQYGNDAINTSVDNIVWEYDSYGSLREFQRLSESVGQHRKKTDTAFSSIIVTLPEKYRKKPKVWQDDFFRNTFDFLRSQFEVTSNGSSNIIAAAVHYDEINRVKGQPKGRPHLHFAFIPVVRNSFERKYKDRKGVERTTTVEAGYISSRYVTTRLVLQHLHPDMDKYLSQTQKGYNGGILLSADEKIEKEFQEEGARLKLEPKKYLKQAKKLSRGLRLKRKERELTEYQLDLFHQEKKISEDRHKIIDIMSRYKKLEGADKSLSEVQTLYSQLQKDYSRLQKDYNLAVKFIEENKPVLEKANRLKNLDDELRKSRSLFMSTNEKLNKNILAVSTILNELPYEVNEIINQKVKQKGLEKLFKELQTEAEYLQNSGYRLKPEKAKVTEKT